MIRRLLLISVLSLLNYFAFSQDGALKGRVTDADTKEPIPTAQVIVKLGGKIVGGAITDFSGDYTIKPIAAGSYDVEVSFMGYGTQRVTGVIINANSDRYLDFKLESSVKAIEGVTIKAYKIPLIDKDNTKQGGTLTKEQIDKMPGRDANSMAVTVGGVFSDDNGKMGGIRGARDGGTATFIDGVRVIGSANLPKAAIEQVSVITGGTPAMYGDLTGGIVNITTRGPSRYFGAGIEGVTSELLDGYGFNLIGLSVQGPLLKGKDSTKSTSLLGFFISAEGQSVRDASPAYGGTYQMNDNDLRFLEQNPFRASGTGAGVFPNSEFVYKDQLVNNHARVNAETSRINASGKIDVRTSDLTTLTFGGSINYGKGVNWSMFNSVFNNSNNGVYNELTWRAYGKFSQRFKNNEKSLIQHVFYSIQADYSQFKRTLENERHGDNLFAYGYVGKFKTHSVKSYELGDAAGMTNIWVHNGWKDTLYDFQRSDINPNLSNYTDQYYHMYDPATGAYRNSLVVQNSGALLNGQLPESVYGLYANTGTPYNAYQQMNNTRFGINANGSMDVGKHEISFGIQYEQRKDAAYGYNPAGLWLLMRNLANRHILQLDLANPHKVYDANGVFQDTVYYDRLYDETTQSFFDVSLREKLGLAKDGTEWIDVDNYDPDMYNIKMFSPDELLNSGNPYVSYYGYDPYGNKLDGRPAFNDFFTKKDENGNYTRTVGAYEPIYMAGYIQDHFSIRDLIFNIGVRVDRFDANQKVLKDPYLFAEAKTVKEVDDLGEIPSNMGDDYVVYVNDLNNPTAIVGYRDGSNWYNASGTQITDPTTLETASGIAPYLVEPGQTNLKATAFKDYDPQTTISPRISFSFPISDQANFFAHYDILTSRPTNGNRLDMINYFFINQVGTKVINNPNLRPERTTDYELGFQQVLSPSSSIKFSAYYREFRDQIQAFRYTSAYPVSYISYNNIDFGTTKGMTIMYDLRRTNNLWMTVSYTLQFASATGSSASSGINLVRSGQPNLRTLSPTNQDRNHQISIVMDYRFGGHGRKYNGPTWSRKEKGTNKVKVVKLLANTGFNATFSGGSGRPYSRQSNVTSALLGGGAPVLDGSINGSRLPWQFRMDMKIDKDIYIKRKDGAKNKNPHYLNVYFQILNVLNTQNVMSVYRYTGNPDDDGYLTAAEHQAAINSYNDTQSFRDLYSTRINNPYNYSLPRRIRFGVIFSF